jgi:hypothetical protein
VQNTIPFQLTPQQLSLQEISVNERVHLTGPAGAGKTSAAVAYLLTQIEQGYPSGSLLILLPQRSLGRPYSQALRQSGLPAGGQATLLTMGGLAQRCVQLFWPAIAQNAGFSDPQRPPVFLTLETAQYFLARLINPLLDQHYFETITIDPGRLYSQIIDNLNKAATVGFSPNQIAEKLKSAWVGKPEQTLIYDQAQECALKFRNFCLEHNLLDFSLQLDTFANFIWPLDACQEYLHQSFRYLVYDNIEEDIPLAQDMIQAWLPAFQGALIIQDQDAGFRSFLGADPRNTEAVKAQCSVQVEFTESLATAQGITALESALKESINHRPCVVTSEQFSGALTLNHQHYYPQMVDWVVSETARLVKEEGISPQEIAILSPLMSDALRFSLVKRFESEGIPVRTNRPSRSLGEEPAAQCLLTLARLAHPAWKSPCTPIEFRNMFMVAFDGLDLVRADLMARTLFTPRSSKQWLGPFDQLLAEKKDRIGYANGQKYEQLRAWLSDYQSGPPLELDLLISRLFGELLSQPGFGFHHHFDEASIAARLIDSIRKFRWTVAEINSGEDFQTSIEYIRMVSAGILAAQYFNPEDQSQNPAVLLAPAYTFLMENNPVSYQFWLDIGSPAWWERLYQPLTHPFVLSRWWPAGKTWTQVEEMAANQLSLERLITGLLRRCRVGVYMCHASLNERGDEPHGGLLSAMQSILKQARGAHV